MPDLDVRTYGDELVTDAKREYARFEILRSAVGKAERGLLTALLLEHEIRSSEKLTKLARADIPLQRLYSKLYNKYVPERARRA